MFLTVLKSNVKRMLANYVCTALRPSLHWREAVVQKGELQTNVVVVVFFRYSLQIWHGYTMESRLNSRIQQLSKRVLDAMLEPFKRVVELYTYVCISL